MKLWFVEMEAAAAAGLRKCFKEKKNHSGEGKVFSFKKENQKKIGFLI